MGVVSSLTTSAALLRKDCVMVIASSVLKSQKAFAHLAESDLAALACCFSARQVSRGDLVFRQGDAGDCLLIVERGHLSVMVRGPEGAQRVVAEAGAGAVLGEMACVDPSPRSATVLARTDASVFVLSRDALNAMRAHAPSLAAVVYDVILRAVLARLRTANDQLLARVGPPARPVSGIVPRATPRPIEESHVARQLRGWLRGSAS